MNQDFVYLVVAGAYSDYHEVAVFKTEEEAEEFCKVYNYQRGNDVYGAAQVHTMPLGVNVDYKNEVPFEVYFDKDGNLKDDQYYYNTIRPRAIEDIDYHLKTGIPCVVEQRPYDKDKEISGYYVVVFAKDFVAARKIACDLLAKHRAERMGI